MPRTSGSSASSSSDRVRGWGRGRRARGGHASTLRSSPNACNLTRRHSAIPEPPIPHEEQDSRSSSEPVQHEVVMAMDIKDNFTIGCAYFSTTDGIVQVSEDISAASLDIAEQFLIHAQPNTLLVSARAPVGCAGALLGDILRRRSAGFLPDGQVAGVLFRVADIRMFSLSSYMYLALTLREIRNLHTTFAQLRKGIEFPSAGQSFDKGVWGTIRKFTTHALTLREIIASLNGGSDVFLFRQVIEVIQPPILVVVREMIDKTIDFEQSKARRRSSVKAGIDSQLDELKRQYDGMDSFLTEVINHVHQELPDWARKYVQSCIFLPQIGFLTVVEPNPDTGNGHYEGEGTTLEAWEKLFNTDGAVCYKNSYMRELDEEYGDMYCQIGDREVEIIHGLVSKVLKHEELLLSSSEVCGEFDAILALALGAEKYSWRGPQVVESSAIHIEEGRHPLQELVVPAFVPNSCHLVAGPQNSSEVQDDSPHAIILTGPNHSGKSVYLKQTAIIVYLAHIGSFVPATQAIIGLTESILTCISPRESMSGGVSAFARDVKQAALSMKTSSPRSLVLVDEFGKGTNGDDGAALLAALLDHYLSLGSDCPRLLAATHFHEVFENG
ncbi:dna mismatch repair protein msh5, partial [Fusarium langsethiae]